MAQQVYGEGQRIQITGPKERTLPESRRTTKSRPPDALDRGHNPVPPEVADFTRARLLWRAKLTEYLLWIIAGLFALRAAWPILSEYGPAELFRSRFYDAFGSNLATGFFLVIIPTLVVFIFGSTPIVLLLASAAARLQGYPPLDHVRAPSLDRKSVEQTAVGVNADRAYEYLANLAKQSKIVADSHLRRSNVHLLGGVLIGMAGLVFFFVMTRSVQMPGYLELLVRRARR